MPTGTGNTIVFAFHVDLFWFTAREKECSMDINEVTLLGTLAREPRSETPAGHSPFVSCALKMGERGRDNVMYYTYVPFDAYGRAADTLVGLSTGVSVFLRGKLTWKRDPTHQTKGVLRVTVWSVTAEEPVAPTPLASAAVSNGEVTC